MTTILVIEDEDAIRTNILEMLDFEGYDPLGAQDGQTGLQIARQECPDLVICDIMMPELDGFGVLEALRDDPITRMVPLIFLTAKSEKSDVRRGMSLGADDYLTKPFTREELLEAVESRLKRQNDLAKAHENVLEDAQKQLTRMVAHELRTPLISINMVQEIIRRKMGNLPRSELEELLDMLGTGTRRMSHLVEQMVFTTQLEAGVINHHSIEETGVPMYLWELLVATVGLARRFAIRNRDVAIRMDQRDRSSMILCDTPSLKHALAELITNALTFSPEDGEVVVTQWETESIVWVSILDEGEGMEPEKVEQALQPFRQIGRETREQQGLGMGLPLARRIIETHGGKMKINSIANRGTQVVVGLPAYHE